MLVAQDIATPNIIVMKQGIWFKTCKKCSNGSISCLNFAGFCNVTVTGGRTSACKYKSWRRKAEFRSPAGNWQQEKRTTGYVSRRRSCPEVEGGLVKRQRWKAPAESIAIRRRMKCGNQQRSSSDLQVPFLKPTLICFYHNPEMCLLLSHSHHFRLCQV